MAGAGQVDLLARSRPAPRCARACAGRPRPRRARAPPPRAPRTPKRRPSRRSALGSADLLGQAERGRVARVAARERAQHQRGVGHVAGQRPALVERRGEGDHPVAADRAVGGLQADDPAQRGGLADRAAGVGADRPRARGRRPRRRRCRRSSRPARAPRSHGFCTGPEAGVLVRRAHRELVLVGLAEHRRARRLQVAHAGRRVRRAGSPRGCASRPSWARPRRRTGP